MKLITLWEPWATLMAIGAKRIETRRWGTDYRGWLAIHSAKGGLSKSDLSEQCIAEPFRSALGECAFKFGHIIAVCRLVDCKMFVSDAGGLGHFNFRMLPPPEPELSFGNYEEGRYGLITSDVFRLPKPIPFKSRQGKLLNVPEEIASELNSITMGFRAYNTQSLAEVIG